jgi:hypothetical protein
MKFIVVLLLASFTAIAADLKINDYNWNLTDITSRGLNKEILYSRMDREFVNTGSSICSNRAHMWANNFKRQYNLDTGKIFLFYTKKKGTVSRKTWWYHVAPIINEGGNIFVMDAGFSGWFNKPMTKEEWLYQFTTSTNCKEINANETDLVQRIFYAQVFPHETAYGNYDCYYKFTPHTIWTPDVLAQNLLGVDSNGVPVHQERPEIDRLELLQACVEATSSKLGYIFGASKEACNQYVNY